MSSQSVAPDRPQYLFIDSAVPDYRHIAANVSPNTVVTVIEAGKDPLSQIAEVLDHSPTNASAIHILSHGSSGELRLGGQTIDEKALQASAAALERIGTKLEDQGDILLYGCNVGAGTKGNAFITALARATDADVAASDDPTGAMPLGGDWQLEKQAGVLESSEITWTGQAHYNHVLASDLNFDSQPLGQTGQATKTYGDFTFTGDGSNNIAIVDDTFNYGSSISEGSNDLVLRFNSNETSNTNTSGFSDSDGIEFALNSMEIAFVDGEETLTITGKHNGNIVETSKISLATNSSDGGVSFSGTWYGTLTFTGWDYIDEIEFVGQTGGDISIDLDDIDVGPAIVPNDAPTASDGSATTNEDTSHTFTTSDFNYSDADGDPIAGVRIVTLPGHGNLAVGGSAVNAGDLISKADLDAGNLVWTPGTDNENDSILTFRVNDGTVDSDSTYTMTLNVTAQNDAPTNTVSGAQAVNEDTGVVFSSANGNQIQVADPDTGDTITTTLGVNNGTLAMTTGGGATITNDGSASVSVSGTVAQVNAALATVTYSPDADWSGSDTLTISTSDGTLTDNDTVAITVNAVNDAPVFSNLDGTPTYTEGGTAVQLDADVAISDAELDAANFDGATLTIARNGGASTTDSFANSGSLASLTESGALILNGETIGAVTTNSGGTLMLTFNASADTARVNEVLRSITYANTSDDPAGPVQLDWAFSDGNTGAQGSGGNKTATGSTTVSITAVNDAPTVTPNSTQPSGGFTEGDSPVPLFDLDTIDAVESGQNIESFSFTFTGAVDGADDVLMLAGLDFPLNGAGGSVSGHTVSIAGGTVTVTFGTPLSGAGAVSFIDGIQYKNTSENPTGDDRVFTLTDITDTGGTSGGGVETVNPNLARTISVSPVNDAPAINNLDGDTTTFAIGGSGVAIDTGTAVSLTDVDNTTLASATVQVTGNYTSSEDVLAFTNDGSTMGNIAESFDTGTGTLALTSSGATATMSEWASALAAVTYTNTNADAGTVTTADRTITTTVNDGLADSASAATVVSVVAAPDIDLDGDNSTGGTNGGLNASFTEDGGPVSLVDDDASIADDNAHLNQLVITLANAQADDAITLSGRSSGEVVDGIFIIYASNSQIMLSGNAPKADYLALMKEAQFNNTSDTPDTTPRTIAFVAHDSDGNVGSAVTATVTVNPADDQPEIGGVSAGQGVLDTGTIQPFSAATLTEPDGENVTVTVSLDDAAKGSFTTLNGFTDAGGGSYTFSGTAPAAQAALRGLVFAPEANRVAPDQTETTTFTLSVEDADGTTDPVTNNTTSVVATSVNTAPTIDGVEGDTSDITAGAGAQALSLMADAAIGDVDSPDFDGGSLVVSQTLGTANGSWGVDGTSVWSNGDSALAAGETVSVGGVAIGTVHATNTGQAGSDLEIDFNASATPARVDTLVQNLTYSAPSGLGERTFQLTVNDGDATNNGGDADTTATFAITVQPNPPVLSGLDGGTVTFTEDGSAVPLDADGNASVTDADSADFATGTLTATITSNGVDSEDILKIADSADGRLTVSGSEVFWDHDDNTGTAAVKIADVSGGTNGSPLKLTLTSNATSGAGGGAEALLRNIAYENTNTVDPSPQNRAVTVQMTDSATDTATSGISTVTIDVTPLNDAPAVATNTGTTVDEGSQSILNNTMLSAIDPDDTASELTYTLTTAPAHGTVSLDGTALTAGGTFTQQDIDNGLVAYQHDGTETTADAIEFTLADGGEDGVAPVNGTFNLTVNPVNDAPTLITDTQPGLQTGQTLTLTEQHLNEGDPDDQGNGLTYTLNTLPATGTLALDGNALAVNDTFTQQDINDGRVTYTASNVAGDFGFKVTLADGGEDGAGTATGTVELAVRLPPPPPEPEQTIDGAPATVEETTDPSTGNAATRLSIEPTLNGRVDEDPTTGDVDVPVGQRVRASVSEDIGLEASHQTGNRDNVRQLLAADRNAQAGEQETNDFLNGLGNENGVDTDIVTLTAGRSVAGPTGDQRLAVNIGQGDGGNAPVVIVDINNLTKSDTVVINGAGNIVVRGSGTFRGEEELEPGGAPDVDNVLGDNSDQSLFFGPGDDIIRGAGGDDYVGSAGGDDRLFGNDGNDTLEGGEGNDTLHGGHGRDTVTINGLRDDYLITQNHSVVTIESLDGTDSDTLINAESVTFNDQSLDLAYGGELNWIATLYDRLLDRQGDLDGVQYWAGQFEQGGNFDDIVWGFLHSEEFTEKLGQSVSALDAGEQVDLLYQTLLQRNADAEGRAYWLNELETGTDLAVVAASMAVSEEASGQHLNSEEWDFIL
ncbi:MAG: DUF4347 domain-containing protein [Alteromonadaceae bacterium]|nr:DUF4347 domain-containing protein [Alteromonadaceae bacterium]